MKPSIDSWKNYDDHRAWYSFMGINQPGSCWKDNRPGHKQSRRFLEWVEENTLPEVIEDLTRGDALMELILLKNG